MSKKIKYTTSQLWMLVILRVLIGWHFLYEGISKFSNSNWSSAPYLMDSKGWFAKLFYAMAGNASVIKIVDQLNIWGLIAIGLGLLLGLFSRIATISGIILLGFYFLSHPALIGVNYAAPSEGSYLFVNKILIELAAMLVLLVLPTSKKIGVDRIIKKLFCKK